MQNKKKVWVQGFSHIMLGLADEPEHGNCSRKSMLAFSSLSSSAIASDNGHQYPGERTISEKAQDIRMPTSDILIFCPNISSLSIPHCDFRVLFSSPGLTAHSGWAIDR